MPAPKSLLKGFARTVATAKPDPKKRIALFDPEARGLCLRITPRGRKTFTVVARDPWGKQVWAAIPDGDPDVMGLEEARALAREGVKRIKAGREAFPPVEPPAPPESFEAVKNNFIKRYVTANELRSAPEIERIFDVYVVPEWKRRPFEEIRRGDVAKLLDKIEDDNGPVMADRVLATLSKLCNWYASRHDDYVSPIVRGMRRAKPAERARTRILSDDELCLIWPVLDDQGTFGAIVKVALLTAQRKAKVAAMRWEDIDDDGTWTIPTEPREKANPGTLKLPEAVLEIVRAQPVVKGNPHVFAGRGAKPFGHFSHAKRKLDAEIAKAATKAGAEPPGHWTIHDLRRTGRSLMSRAGVRPDVSERVLGHAIPGVEGVYDRHSYAAEKADALAKLAAMVDGILNPAAADEKVVALRAEG